MAHTYMHISPPPPPRIFVHYYIYNNAEAGRVCILYLVLWVVGNSNRNHNPQKEHSAELGFGFGVLEVQALQTVTVQYPGNFSYKFVCSGGYLRESSVMCSYGSLLPVYDFTKYQNFMVISYNG